MRALLPFLLMLVACSVAEKSSPAADKPWPVTARFEYWGASFVRDGESSAYVTFENPSEQLCRVKSYSVDGITETTSLELEPRAALTSSGVRWPEDRPKPERPEVKILAVECQPWLTPEECQRVAPLQKCAAPDPAIARFSSYNDVEIGRSYWLQMKYQDQVWQPAETLGQPYHHATSLELTNLATLPDLARRKCGLARMTVEIQKREIDPRPEQHLWFTTYQARVISACAP